MSRENRDILRTIMIMVLVVACSFAGGFASYIFLSARDAAKSDSLIIGEDTSVTPVSQTGTIIINEDGALTVAEAIAEKTLPSVVGITTTVTTTYSSGYDFFGYYFGGGGFGQPQTQDATYVGTGVIVDEAGYILTNSHVINDGTYKSISVNLYDGRDVEGTVLYYEPTLDIAVVKIEAGGLTAAELGDSDELRIGSYAAAIGNPLGMEFERSMSQGIISGMNRTITVSSSTSSSGTTMEGLLQTDATINSGNSGGPLLNSRGEVVGINSAKASSGEGMGFAIPINSVKPIVEQIKLKGSFERVYIGIKGVGLSSSGYSADALKERFGVSDGIYVSSVYPGGGAAAAGLQEGDVITEVGGRAVGTMNRLNTILVAKSEGEKIKVTYYRNGVANITEITLTGASALEE